MQIQAIGQALGTLIAVQIEQDGEERIFWIAAPVEIRNQFADALAALIVLQRLEGVEWRFRRKTHGIKLVAQIRSLRFMYLEKFLHLELKDYEITREWYSDEQKVLEIVINFLKQHGSVFGAYDIHILPR